MLLQLSLEDRDVWFPFDREGNEGISCNRNMHLVAQTTKPDHKQVKEKCMMQENALNFYNIVYTHHIIWMGTFK